jgi:IS5 family transposase
MPKGPQGQKRPADSIGLAVMVGKIATGEIEETTEPKAHHRKGGKARATSLSADARADIARLAAEARWRKT